MPQYLHRERTEARMEQVKDVLVPNEESRGRKSSRATTVTQKVVGLRGEA